MDLFTYAAAKGAAKTTPADDSTADNIVLFKENQDGTYTLPDNAPKDNNYSFCTFVLEDVNGHWYYPVMARIGGSHPTSGCPTILLEYVVITYDNSYNDTLSFKQFMFSQSNNDTKPHITEIGTRDYKLTYIAPQQEG